MTWHPSSPLAQRPGMAGSAWRPVHPLQERVAAFRRLQGGVTQHQPITPAPEGQPLPHSARWRRLVAVAWREAS